MMLHTQPGDVGFTRSNTKLGAVIRYVDVSPDGRPTWANHMLMFTTPGVVGNVPVHQQAMAVEAQWHVEHKPWWDRHKDEPGNRIRVYRPLFLRRLEDVDVIVARALEHVGARYGYWKLGAHALDRYLFNGEKVISSLLFLDSRPICSYLVADAYAEAGYLEAFGQDPQGVSPDSGLDFCEDYSYGAFPLWKLVGETQVPVV